MKPEINLQLSIESLSAYNIEPNIIADMLNNLTLVLKKKNQILYTMESWMIANGKSGQTFYSRKKDRHLTAIATHHNRKITTERFIIITTAKLIPIANNITKVTLL